MEIYNSVSEGIMRKAIVLYEQGLSLKQLSKEVEMPRETLRAKLKRAGVELRKSRRDLAIKYHSPIEGIDENVAELLGLHAGDGWLSKDKWGTACNSNDKNLISRVYDLSRKVLGIEPTLSKSSLHGVHIRSGQRQVIEYFKRRFPVGKKAYTIRIPNDIMESKDIRVIKGVLRGLFSSDGCFNFRKRGLSPYVRFHSKSKVLRDQFIELASKLGLRCHAYTAKHRTGVIYIAQFSDKCTVLRWMDEVGTTCDTHIRIFGTWKKLKRE